MQKYINLRDWGQFANETMSRLAWDINLEKMKVPDLTKLNVLVEFSRSKDFWKFTLPLQSLAKKLAGKFFSENLKKLNQSLIW